MFRQVFDPSLRLVAVVFAIWLAGCSEAAPVLPLEIRLLSRALTPGEPVRIDVRSTEPLAALDASFLDRTVFMSRGVDDRQWSGWTLIPLDAKAGAAVVELRGSTTAGAEARGTHAVTVAPKEFPEERLTVESKYVTPPPEVKARLERERAKLARIYRSRRETAPLSRPFVRPVPGEQSSVFGTRRILNGEPRSPHPGIDLRSGEGTPVHAAGPASVVLAQDLYYSGNTVILDHGGGLFTLYAHLSRIDVEEAQEVAAGALVGLVGATGRVTGPHLHWGAKIGNQPFDPAALLDPSLFE